MASSCFRTIANWLQVLTALFTTGPTGPGCVPRGDGWPDTDAFASRTDSGVGPFELGADIQLFEKSGLFEEDEAWVVVLRVRWLAPGVDAQPLAQVGDCGVYDEWSILPEAEIEHLDAGAVTVRGSSVFPEVTFTVGSDGRYVSNLPETFDELFAEGDLLEFDFAGGGGFAAGSGALVAPTEATLVQPVVSGGFTAPISRAVDLLVAWPVPALPGDTLYVSMVSSTDWRVTCVVPDDGSLTLPAELLSYMPPGPVRLTFARVLSVETANLDGHRIRANAWSRLDVETTLE